MELEEAKKIQDFINSSIKFKHLDYVHSPIHADNGYKIKVKIIDDSTEIKVIKKLFGFAKEYDSCSYNFIEGIKIRMATVYCTNLINIIDKKGYFGLGNELNNILSYKCLYIEEFKIFEEKLYNVISVLLLQKLIPMKRDFEFGIIKIIRCYFNTNDYDSYLKEIVPKLY